MRASKTVVQDQLMVAERKANANKNNLEELRNHLDQVDKNRRNIENELTDTNETLGDQTVQNQVKTSTK